MPLFWQHSSIAILSSYYQSPNIAVPYQKEELIHFESTFHKREQYKESMTLELHSDSGFIMLPTNTTSSLYGNPSQDSSSRGIRV